ncbi:MAG TPA: hypothetical protein VGG70_04945 [Candidatus Cybelea sp.]|jgi:hypothetical protein
MTLKGAKNSARGDVAVVAFELVSVDPTAAPNGGAGDDWLVYRISQGLNVVTGYRSGNRAQVVAEVERIVVALNERQHVRGRPYYPTRRSSKRPPTPLKDLL